MKIMLLKSSLLIDSAGGAEKIFCDFSNALIQRGHQVLAITEDKKKGLPFFPLNPQVDFRNIGKKWVQRLPRWLRPLCMKPTYAGLIEAEKPDCIIGFFYHDIDRLPSKKPPTILMQHSHPSVYLKRKKLSKYKKLLGTVTAVQVLQPSFMFDIMRLNPDVPVQCIGNPVQPCLPENQADLSHEKKVIICVGRVEKDKGCHLLILAMNQLQKKFPDWQVHFYGSCPEKEYKKRCDALVHQYHLEKVIHFFAPTSDILARYKTADIGAFPSRFEGFSLALTEAMATGLPVLAMEHCPGLNELIHHNQNGLLAKSSLDGLVQALSSLMQDKSLRKRLGTQAQKDMQAYAPEIILDQWEQLITQAVRKTLHPLP